MREAIQMKSQVVAEIVEKLQKSSSTIVVDYKGLTVEEVTELRKKMREAGVEYKVYKNTLVRRAAKEVGIAEFNDELLVGTNAIAFGYDDPIAPARVIKEFMDAHPKMQLKMGVVEGTFYNEAQIVRKYTTKRSSSCKITWKLKSSNVKLRIFTRCSSEKTRRSRSLIVS